LEFAPAFCPDVWAVCAEVCAAFDRAVCAAFDRAAVV